MVSRKPVPQSPGVASAPYPVTPVTSHNPSDFPVQSTQSTDRPSQNSGAEDTNEDINAWNQEGIHDHGKAMADMPEVLRVGPPGGVKQRPSQEVLKHTALTTNPFLQKQNTRNASETKESSAAAWGNPGVYPEPPSGRPPPPPVTITQGMFFEIY